MSFPERSGAQSPTSHGAAPNQDDTAHPVAPAPLSVTLAIFDSTLPVRVRAFAAFSSLAVNLLLPFLNGVMLGFGEIFAKNVVLGWFGWRPSTTVAGTVGVGTTEVRPGQQRRRPGTGI